MEDRFPNSQFPIPNSQSPLVVIVGPTASGKSAVAMELARKFNGEIVCADARTIYKGMDIGTAKPSTEDRAAVPHHILDVTTPDQMFTAAEFKKLAQAVIVDISARGKIPIMVGGTGLYVDAVLYDFNFRDVGDPAERRMLEGLSIEELQTKITDMGLELPANARNPRHLIRTIETKGEVPKKQPMRKNTLVIGMEIDQAKLKRRISRRVEAMLEAGLRDEVLKLAEQYGWDAPGMNAIGYREWRNLLNDEVAAAAEILRDTKAYAKRQKTWFRRNKSIQWFTNRDDIVDIATTVLNKTEH